METKSASRLAAAEPETPALSGYVLAGKYRITKLIGEGGMGAVYEGEHLDIGKRVAIKVVHAAFASGTEVAERFRREARAAAAVESEHIVQVFDVGEDPALGLFMVMELLRGRELGALLREGGPLDIPTACAIVAQAATGLEAAHAAGIVHRDLKPANLFLVPRADGTIQVKIVDFGVAKIRDARAAGGAAITRIGSALGTPQYMAPEQAQGLPDIDLRVDVYALGCVLYESLVGTPAYAELPTYEQMIIQLVTKPTPHIGGIVPGVPAGLDELCARMMHREPAQRPAGMGVVLEELFAIVPEAAEPPVISGLEGSGPRTSRLHPSSPRPRIPAAPESRRLKPIAEVALPEEPPVSIARPPRRSKLGVLLLVGILATGLGAAVTVKVAKTVTSPIAPSASATGASAPPSGTPVAPASSVTEVPAVASSSPSPAVAAPVVTPSVAAPSPVLVPGPLPGKGRPKPAPAASSKVGSAGVAEQF